MGEKDDNNGDKKTIKGEKIVGGENIERKKKEKKKMKPAAAEAAEADIHHGVGEKKEEKDGLTTTNTIALKLDLHCDDCALKIRSFIQNYNGVEQVKGDSAGGILTVIGKVDPNWLRAKVEKKTRNKVELVHQPISSHQPANKAGGDGGDKKGDDKTHKKKSDEKSKVRKGDGDGDEVKLQEEDNHQEKVKHKRQGDQINPDNHNQPKQVLGTTAVLKIPLHCDDCAIKIKRILKKIDGIQNVSMDNEKDLVTLQGTMDMMELTPFLKRRLKRKVDIVSLNINDTGSSGNEGENKGKETTTGDDVIDKTAACHGGGHEKEKNGGVNKEKKEKAERGGGGDDKKVKANNGGEKKEKESNGASDGGNKNDNEGVGGEGKKEKLVDKSDGGDSGGQRQVDDSKVSGDKGKDGGGNGGDNERRVDDSKGGGDKGKAKIEEPKVEVSKMEYQGYGTPYTYYGVPLSNHNYANQGYDLSTMHDPGYHASTSYVVEYNDPHNHHLHHFHQPQIPPPPPTYLPPPHDHILSDENPNACSVM